MHRRRACTRPASHARLCPRRRQRSSRFTSAARRGRRGAIDQDRVVAGQRADHLGQPAPSMATPRIWACPGPVRSSTSCCTRSTRVRYSARARRRQRTWPASPVGGRARGAAWYAPSAPPFTSPSSRMSRDSVAWVTSKPAARSRRRSCSWLRTGSRWTTSRIDGLAAGLHELS